MKAVQLLNEEESYPDLYISQEELLEDLLNRLFKPFYVTGILYSDIIFEKKMGKYEDEPETISVMDLTIDVKLPWWNFLIFFLLYFITVRHLNKTLKDMEDLLEGRDILMDYGVSQLPPSKTEKELYTFIRDRSEIINTVNSSTYYDRELHRLTETTNHQLEVSDPSVPQREKVQNFEGEMSLGRAMQCVYESGDSIFYDRK